MTQIVSILLHAENGIAKIEIGVKILFLQLFQSFEWIE